MDVVDPDGLARSDNSYGWAKIAYENLGFMFAAGKIPLAHDRSERPWRLA